MGQLTDAQVMAAMKSDAEELHDGIRNTELVLLALDSYANFRSGTPAALECRELASKIRKPLQIKEGVLTWKTP